MMFLESLLISVNAEERVRDRLIRSGVDRDTVRRLNLRKH